MKRTLCLILALLAAPAFAQSSTTTGSNGNGSQIAGTVQQTVGDRQVTLTVSNLTKPVVVNTASPYGPGVTVGTFSAGLSTGAVLGNGFGNTSGTSGTVAGPFGF